MLEIFCVKMYYVFILSVLHVLQYLLHGTCMELYTGMMFTSVNFAICTD